MPQYKSKDQSTYPRRCGKKLVTGKVVNATLDSSRGLNRCFVIVSLNDGVKLDFPVPTTQEIRDRFFYKKAKTQPDKPARPPNKFFIFRTMFQGAIDDFKLQVPIVSGLASEVWKKCSPEVVDLFTKLSQIAKSEHSEINPGYVYKPNRTKSRIPKSKDSPQEQSYQDVNNSSSPTLNDLPTSLWAADHLCRISSQANFNHDENSYTMEDPIITAQDQAIPSHYDYCYLSAIDPSVCDITSPFDTCTFNDNDSYQQLLQYPYYPNNDLSMCQYIVPNIPCVQDMVQQSLTSIPHCFPTTINHVNDGYNEIFNSPTSESEDMALSSNISTFCMEQLNESGCIDYYPDDCTFFSDLFV